MLLACMQPSLDLTHSVFVCASAECSHSGQAILQGTSATLIGGPILSDCISGPAGSQHGLNRIGWCRIGWVQRGRSKSGRREEAK